MMKSSASHTVAVMLLGIALLELGFTHRFGQLWQLAFGPHQGGISEPVGNVPHPAAQTTAAGSPSGSPTIGVE